VITITYKLMHIISNSHMDALAPRETAKLCKREVPRTSDGLVFNIMRFAINDGPGIRTTVFLKGCQLNCWWCHNPESRLKKPELIYDVERCIRCGDCVRACPEGALELNAKVTRNRQHCRLCAQCVDLCSTGAQELVGRWMSVSQVMEQILRDQIFFDQSSGGVTISGGEPMMQADFVEALAAACRARRIHTALDTCGDAEWQQIDRVRANVDLFLYDLKLMDPIKHEHFTGVRNDRILENLKRLAERGSNITVRIPLIPGVNDDEGNLAAVSTFLAPLGLRNIDLLPYHGIAAGKYDRLGLKYRMKDLIPFTTDNLRGVAERLRQDGFHVQIGGLS